MANEKNMNKHSKTFEVGKKYYYYDHSSLTMVNGEAVYRPRGVVEIVSRTPVAMVKGYIALNTLADVPVLKVKVNGKTKYAEVHCFNDKSMFADYEGLHILTNNLQNWGRGTIRFHAEEVR